MVHSHNVKHAYRCSAAGIQPLGVMMEPQAVSAEQASDPGTAAAVSAWLVNVVRERYGNARRVVAHLLLLGRIMKVVGVCFGVLLAADGLISGASGMALVMIALAVLGGGVTYYLGVLACAFGEVVTCIVDLASNSCSFMSEDDRKRAFLHPMGPSTPPGEQLASHRSADAGDVSRPPDPAHFAEPAGMVQRPSRADQRASRDAT